MTGMVFDDDYDNDVYNGNGKVDNIRHSASYSYSCTIFRDK